MNVNAIGSIARIGLGSASPVNGSTSIRSVGGSDSGSSLGSIDGSNGQKSAGGSFLDTLGQAFGQLNTQLNAADSTMANFASGGSADLHSVMLQMEEASISLKVGTQVRDKLIEAYQELMRTQI